MDITHSHCDRCPQVHKLDGRINELSIHHTRTHDWVRDVAADVKEVKTGICGIRGELSSIRESIAAFKGKVNAVIAVAATIATTFVAVAIKLIFEI